ncbi:hypothetical protein GCM10010360_25170 [Streptomyces nogalater]
MGAVLTGQAGEEALLGREDVPLEPRDALGEITHGVTSLRWVTAPYRAGTPHPARPVPIASKTCWT